MFPDKDDVHSCEERMFVNSHISGNKVLLGFWSQQIPVWPEVELFFSGRLVGDLVDGQ